jgi:hypothetical protein
VKLYDF